MFRKALDADPMMAPAFVNLGNAHYHLQQNAQAVTAWNAAARSTSWNAPGPRTWASTWPEKAGNGCSNTRAVRGDRRV